MIVFSALVLFGCGGRIGVESPPPAEASSTPTAEQTSTATPTATLTETPEPLAAIVNGGFITMAEFTAELERYRRAGEGEPGTNLATNGVSEETIVIQSMIEQLLLAQGASQAGYSLDGSTLESRYEALTSQTDLPTWLQENGYTEASFRAALGRSIEAAWMRDQIILGVPVTAEQIHARQILLYNLEEANQVYANLQSGADFDGIAALYDPMGRGDIGWFPRGYLTEPAIEEAAFGLQAGELSGIIETRLGFHILKIIAREAQRNLEPDALLVLQSQAVQQWLDESKAQSEIQVMLP